MATKNPNYDIDMSGLENLLDGVVAYLEVRNDFEDISNEIAREMRQMGAIISDKRDKKVTHVIFKNGTYRTSNWAKKHNVPLVSVGWLAACARKRLKFLCAPWREPYLIENVDDLGLKKRIRYKKYCKAMNLEEFEADMNRSAERLKKRMNKSMDKSNSFTTNDNGLAEYERIMKLSDPMLRPRPPTPEYVKKHQQRHERLKERGRYSWESSDEDKSDTTEDSDKGISNDNSLIMNDKSTKSNEPSSVINVIAIGDDCTENRNGKAQTNGVRRLFQNDSTTQQTLIEPTYKTKKTKILKKILPKVVLREVDKSSPKEKKRKRPLHDIESPPAKRSRKDHSITHPCDKSTKNVTLDAISQLLRTPILLKTERTVNNSNLSPLVTNRATACSTPQNDFVTPMKKRRSLRTRLLKNSARKLYREGMLVDNDVSSVTESPSQRILVPETELVDKRKGAPKRSPIQSPSDPRMVPETPLCTIEDNSVTSNSSSDNPHCDSMTSSHLRAMFDTPNASRILNEIFPNREKCESKNHILFVPKDSYNHCSKAITPNFTEKIKQVAAMFHHQSVDKLEPQKTVPRANVRRSTRLSNCYFNEFVDFNPDTEVDTAKDDESSKENVATKKSIPRRSSIPKSFPAKETLVSDNDRRDAPVNSDDLKVTRNTRCSTVLLQPYSHEETSDTKTDTVNPVPSEPPRRTRRSNVAPHHEEAITRPNVPDFIPIKPKRNTRRSNVRQTETLLSANNTVHINVATTDPLNPVPVETQRETCRSSVARNLLDEVHTVEKKYNTRQSIVKAHPLVLPTPETFTEATKTKPNLKRQWTAVGQEPDVQKKVKVHKKTIFTVKFRDSTDDFVFNIVSVPESRITSKSLLCAVTNEVVFVGVEAQELAGIRAGWTRLPQKYKCAEIIRTKEQLVVVPDSPRRNMELIKAFIFGNTFVSLRWVLESQRQNKWLNYSAYTVPHAQLIEAPTSQSQQASHLFKGYTAMYISTKAHALPKYKLRFVIEQSGGTVTDSFRQAGIVIDTRKVNALSVSSAWILDSVKEGRIMDHKNYGIV